MKVRVIAHLLMGACLFSAAAYSAAADERALEIIRRADEVRSPNKPFRYTLTIHEFKAGATRPENKQVLDISMRFMKPEGNQSGCPLHGALCLSPARQGQSAALRLVRSMVLHP